MEKYVNSPKLYEIISDYSINLDFNIFSRRQETNPFTFNGSTWRLKMVKFREKVLRMYLNKISDDLLNKFRTFVYIQDKNDIPQFPSGWCNWSSGTCVWERDISDLQSKKDNLLTDGEATFVILFMRLAVAEDETKREEKAVQASINAELEASEENLALDFHHLLKTGIHSDIILSCGDTTMPAHSCILSVRSKVFAAMLQSDMVKRSKGVFEIANMDPPILDQFLQFIYSGKVFDLSMRSAPQLYEAADKYDVELLKKQCSILMIENLAEDNACRVLTLADACNDEDLKDCAIAFIMKTKLFKNDDIWLKFCNDQPQLAIEILNREFKEICSDPTRKSSIVACCTRTIDDGSLLMLLMKAETNICLKKVAIDFSVFLNDGNHSDVTLKCRGNNIPAHKIILSARSKVLAAMLHNGMAESHTAIIEIFDIEPLILNQLLQFIYSGKVLDLTMSTAPQLYYAADKYDIQSLKEICSFFMRENLTAKNACSILSLADTHSDKDMKEYAIVFVLKSHLINNDDIWLEFCDEHTKLAIETLNYAYKNYCK